MLKGRGKTKVTTKLLLAAGMLAVSAASAFAGPVRTPPGWASQESATQNEIFFGHKVRSTAMLNRVGPDVGENADIAALLAKLSLPPEYQIESSSDAKSLKETDFTRSMKLRLGNGKQAFYFAIVKRNRAGETVVSASLHTRVKSMDEVVGDLKVTRGLNNQLRRGAVPGEQRVAKRYIDAGPNVIALETNPQPMAKAAEPPAPAVSAKPSKKTALVTKPPKTPAIDLPAPVTPIGEAPSAPLIPAPQPSVLGVIPARAAQPTVEPKPPALAVPATVAPVTKSLPAPASKLALPAGKGVPLGQVAAVLYAPLESSEVFVLFKDGSFHETLPSAFEEWDVPGSRKAEPDNWGKWKRSAKAGEYEMKYSADDVVTISATQVAPVVPGTKLGGTYAIETQSTTAAPKTAVHFDGDRFTLKSAKGEIGGTYKVEGYTIALSFDDGRAERRPFFFVPVEEEDDEPSIWFGDEVRSKVDA